VDRRQTFEQISEIRDDVSMKSEYSGRYSIGGFGERQRNNQIRNQQNAQLSFDRARAIQKVDDVEMVEDV
jgi:hypothetical protein